MTKEYTCEDCKYFMREGDKLLCVEPGEEIEGMASIAPCCKMKDEALRLYYLVKKEHATMKPIQIMAGNRGRMYVLYDNGEVWYRDFSPGEWLKYDLPTEDELNENR